MTAQVSRHGGETLVAVARSTLPGGVELLDARIGNVVAEVCGAIPAQAAAGVLPSAPDGGAEEDVTAFFRHDGRVVVELYPKQLRVDAAL